MHEKCSYKCYNSKELGNSQASVLPKNFWNGVILGSLTEVIENESLIKEILKIKI
jgi:hypothetical protein